MRRLFLSSLLLIALTFSFSPTHAKEYSIDNLKVLADSGNAEAQYELASHYMKGTDIKKDTAKGINLFMKSAAKGYPKAQYVLGKLFRDGLYVKQSEQQAMDWFTRGAHKGHGNSQYALAVMHSRFRDSLESTQEAYAWFEVVHIRKHPRGAAGRDEVAKRLDKYQIIEAKRMAKAYYEEYVEPFQKPKVTPKEESDEPEEPKEE